MLDQRMYFLGYRFAIKNAKAHYKAAKHLARYVNYGIATSHLVLAVEEAIKALILYEASKGFVLSDKDFDLFFSAHKHKHNFLKDSLTRLDPVNTIGQIIYNVSKRAFGRSEKNESNPIKKKLKGNKKIHEKLESITGEIEHEKIVEWLDKANSIRNDGFYIGFLRETKFWSTPRYFTKREFEDGCKIVEEVITKYVGNGIWLSSMWSDMFKGENLSYRKD
jgi:AbiV family abortive infection protein